MNYLSDIINYVRRIVKTPSNQSLSDSLIIDYINRFWMMDVDARIQLFDLKTSYSFQTIPGVSEYNMPLYSIQNSPTDSNQFISPFPVYQGFFQPCFVNGIEVPLYTDRNSFWKIWPNYIQQLNPVAQGNGTAGPYSFQLPYFPAIPGHIDITGIIAQFNRNGSIQDPPTGLTLNTSIPITSVNAGVFICAQDSTNANVVISDSGQFFSSNQRYGLLMQRGDAPNGCISLGAYGLSSNTVNYDTGVVNVTFPDVIPSGNTIQAQCYFYEQGLPRSILYYNNTLSIRPPPDTQYLVQLDGYLSPCAFLNSSQAIPFGYMAEYIARGASRKILSDTGDVEQFLFYEPLFKEQEILVWKRSQRIFTSSRIGTIFSDLQGPQAGSLGSGQGGT